MSAQSGNSPATSASSKASGSSTTIDNSRENTPATTISNQGSQSIASTNLDVQAMEAENARLRRELAIKNEEIARLRNIATPQSGNRFELVTHMTKQHEQEQDDLRDQCRRSIKGWKGKVQGLENCIEGYKTNEANLQQEIIRRDEYIIRLYQALNDRDDLVSWQHQEIINGNERADRLSNGLDHSRVSLNVNRDEVERLRGRIIGLEEELALQHASQEEVEFLRERVAHLEDTHSQLAEEIAALTSLSEIQLRRNQEFGEHLDTVNETLAAEQLRSHGLVDPRTRINYIEIMDEVAENLRARINGLERQRAQQALTRQRLSRRRVDGRQTRQSRRKEYPRQILERGNQDNWDRENLAPQD